MASVATFTSPIAARVEGRPVQVIAVAMEGGGSTASVQFLVVGLDGRASLVRAEQANLSGAVGDDPDAKAPPPVYG